MYIMFVFYFKIDGSILSFFIHSSLHMSLVFSPLPETIANFHSAVLGRLLLTRMSLHLILTLI